MRILLCIILNVCVCDAVTCLCYVHIMCTANKDFLVICCELSIMPSKITWWINEFVELTGHSLVYNN